MICPTCKNLMIVVEYSQIELDHCLNCHGVWFDAGELQLLLERMGITSSEMDADGLINAPVPKTREKKRKCPICSKIMKKANIGQQPIVMIDACTEGDGLWFDGGEVHALVSQLAKGKGSHQKIISFLKEAFKAEE
ncbi:MAG: zf-TFIIB domain-containing protein [Candidatus Omnitrophica bacterium]|nr:zf-TFIIB domain-containing protein [Candidatus Omnitrophota bacterium]